MAAASDGCSPLLRRQPPAAARPPCCGWACRCCCPIRQRPSTEQNECRPTALHPTSKSVGSPSSQVRRKVRSSSHTSNRATRYSPGPLKATRGSKVTTFGQLRLWCSVTSITPTLSQADLTVITSFPSFYPSTTAKLSGQQNAGRAADNQPASPSSPPKSPDLHRPIMQAMPDTRQQSFDEIYGAPENFLEIEVSRRLQIANIITP